ncbi:MAG: TolC family protein [Planctomycetaceae bacterium]
MPPLHCCLRRSVARGLLLITVLARAASAQESVEGGGADVRAEESFLRPPRMLGRILTLEELQQLAVNNNPTLEQARAATRSAYGRRLQAGRRPNPTVGYVASEMGNEGEAGQQGVFVEQEFVRGNKRELSQAVASREMQQAEQVLAMQALRVSNAVRREFYAVLVAERRQELAGELVRIAGEASDVNAARLKRKEGTQIEIAQSDVEFEDASLLLFDAEKQHEAAWRRLQAIVAAPELAQTRLAGDLDDQLPDLTWEQSWMRLVETSPQIARAQFAVARAQARLARERAEPTSNVTVQASTQYDTATRTQVAGLQIGLPIPIHNKNQGNIIDAEADVTRAMREVQRLELELQSRLADEFRDYELSRRQVERYRDAILPASRKSLELSQTVFKTGDLGYLQLLTAQRTFTGKNREYVEALARLWQSVVDIEGLLLVDGLAAPEGVDAR